jgi:short-subunit dehydrogenase
MFKGKTFIVTGASSGLGEALALKLAGQDINLVLFSRNEEKLRIVEQLCKKSGAAVLHVKGDVTDPADCERLINKTVESFHSIDFLILAAGVSMWARFDEVSDLSVFKKIMETNYIGAINLLHYAIPFLKKTRGMIIAISSIQGKISVPFHTGYVASKHALTGFLDTLRIELEASGVHILQVMPHWLRGTNLRSNAFGRNGDKVGDLKTGHNKESISLEECTDRILIAMKNKKRELIIPWKLKLLLWLKLLSPVSTEKIITRKVGEQKS